MIEIVYRLSIASTCITVYIGYIYIYIVITFVFNFLKA